MPPERAGRALVVLRVCFGLSIAVGAFLRLHAFALRRSLWMDEAMLAVNIPARSPLELLRPLDYGSSAPFLFLWLERAAVAVFGTSELSLRTPPMLAGLLIVPLAFLAGRRLFGDAGAAAAALLAALSPTLVRFSNEVKPYGTDAFATLAIIGAAVAVAQQPRSSRSWQAFALVAPLAILSSFSALFVAASSLAALVLVRSVREERRAWLFGCAVVSFAAFVLPYLLIYRGYAGGSNFQEAWGAAFLTPGAGFLERLKLALPGTLLPTFLGDGAVAPSLTPARAVLILAALSIGLIEAARRHGAWAVVLLAGPLGVAGLASAVRRYPVGVPRLMVFAAPALILIAAGAAAGVHRAFGRGREPLWALALLLIVAPTVRDDVAAVRQPYQGEDARALVKAYRNQRRGDQEPVYINATAIPAWVFYTTNWSAPKRDRLAFYATDHPLPPDGLNPVYDFRGRREILGLSPGRDWTWPNYVREGPQEGWAQNEARSIYGEAVKDPRNPCAWLFFTRLSQHANKPLAGVLRDVHRGVLDAFFTAPGGVLYRYCFPTVRPS